MPSVPQRIPDRSHLVLLASDGRQFDSMELSRWLEERRPDGSIYMERHRVSDFPERNPLWTKPMLRGMWGLVDALTTWFGPAAT